MCRLSVSVHRQGENNRSPATIKEEQSRQTATDGTATPFTFSHGGSDLLGNETSARIAPPSKKQQQRPPVPPPRRRRRHELVCAQLLRDNKTHWCKQEVTIHNNDNKYRMCILFLTAKTNSSSFAKARRAIHNVRYTGQDRYRGWNDPVVRQRLGHVVRPHLGRFGRSSSRSFESEASNALHCWDGRVRRPSPDCRCR